MHPLLSSLRYGSVRTAIASRLCKTRLRPISTSRSSATNHHRTPSRLLGSGTVRSHYHYSGPGSPPVHPHDNDSSTSRTPRTALEELWSRRDFHQRGFTVGIGGPVGSGKTATVLALCRALSQSHNHHNHNATSTPPVSVVTNDIFTQEDAEFLIRHQALPAAWMIAAVETGGCPHAAIREDVSANLSALEDLTLRHNNMPQQQHNQHNSKDMPISSSSFCPLLLCESGGDNLAANFSRELADLTLYVIDVAGGDKVPRKGGPGITESDLLVINKVDLADAVGANLPLMQYQAQAMRRYPTHNQKMKMNHNHHQYHRFQDHSHDQDHHHSHDLDHSHDQDHPQDGKSFMMHPQGSYAPIVMASIKHQQGLQEIVDFILQHYHRAMDLSRRREEEEP